MKIKYFQITDTLYIELYPAVVDETQELDKTRCRAWTARGASAP